MTAPKPDLLAQAATHLILDSSEADARYGEGRPGLEEALDDWAHQARHNLTEAFGVTWNGPSEDTADNLETLATHWPERPDDETLAGMALEWAPCWAKTCWQTWAGTGSSVRMPSTTRSGSHASRWTSCPCMPSWPASSWAKTQASRPCTRTSCSD